MFKPTSDNYEALTRAQDYLNQVYDEIPKNDDNFENVRIYLYDAITDIDVVLSELDEHSK